VKYERRWDMGATSDQPAGREAATAGVPLSRPSPPPHAATVASSSTKRAASRIACMVTRYPTKPVPDRVAATCRSGRPSGVFTKQEWRVGRPGRGLREGGVRG